MAKGIIRGLLAAVAALSFCGAAIAADLPKKPNEDEIKKILSVPQAVKGKDKFRFIVMGDTRDGDQLFAYMLSLANSMDPLFIIDVGDLVHSGAEPQYLNYFSLIKDSPKPFISVVGNHENHEKGGIERYESIFGQTDFFFDYGDSRFIVIDNAARGYTLTDAQLAWLDKTLETTKKTFIFMHAPPKTRKWTGGMDTKAAAKFMELAERKKVRRVYFGHIHAYDRLQRGDTVYEMTGCAGAEPDPIGDFYAKNSGGFYHFSLVEVDGDNVMDVLVTPDTSDILKYPSPLDGAPLEFAYAGYRHHNTPIIEKVETGDGTLSSKKSTPVKAVAYSNPKAFNAGLTQLEMTCFDSKGNSTSAINIREDYFDERNWAAEIPALAPGKAICSLHAQDSLRASTYFLPSMRELKPSLPAEPKLSDIPFTVIARDMDEPSVKLLDEFDVRDVAFAYDAKNFYIKMNVQGGFQPGTTNPRAINMYGVVIIDENLVLEPDVKKMLGTAPVIAYAPLATSLGFPKCGYFNLANFDNGKIDSGQKGVKCDINGDTLTIRADRSLYGKPTKGIKLLVLTGRLMMQPRLDAKAGDISDIANIRLNGVPFNVK